MDGKIFNSRGVHVAIILGPTIFNLKGKKLYDLRGVNIYKLSGELVGHLANAQGADRLLDKATDKLFPASCFPAPNSLVCVYSQAKGKLTFARSRRDRFFGNRVRPNCTAQGRQQTVGADEAEGLAWLQVRWDGQRHQTVGW